MANDRQRSSERRGHGNGGILKLYHWQVKVRDMHGRAPLFSFLTMAEDVMQARKICLEQVPFAPVMPAGKDILIRALKGPPSKVVESGYPIVIW